MTQTLKKSPGRPKGLPKTGGRPKGSLNKRSEDFLQVLEKHNFCPASAMIEVYQEAKKIYDSYGIIYEAISKAREEKGLIPLADNAHQYLKIAQGAAADMMQYAYPRLKSIEHQKPDPFAGMTDTEKAKVLEEALAFMKDKIEQQK